MAQSKQSTTKQTTILDCITNFSVDLYRKVAKDGSTDVFISPCSVFVAMAMLDVGAKGSTLQQISSVLNIENMEMKDVLEQMKQFTALLERESSSIALHTANRLFPDDSSNVKEEYLQLARKYFNSTVEALDFAANSESARKDINAWVENQTQHKITNAVPAGAVSAATRLVIVNAIYFKGLWETQFSLSDTKKEDFFVTKETKVKIEMMNNEIDTVRYGEHYELDCKMLEMMYKGNEIGMVILLPNRVDGLTELEENLTFEKVAAMETSYFVTPKVTVALPKFKLEISTEMNSVLQALGIVDAFDSEKSNLSGIGEGLFVSDVFHKAFVDVNEEGTEAAASTAVVINESITSVPVTYKFIADHPFLFMIWDHILKVPLFMGRYTGPK